jgi:hypothetical protein
VNTDTSATSFTYGGYFVSKNQFGAGVLGTSEGSNGSGVEGRGVVGVYGKSDAATVGLGIYGDVSGSTAIAAAGIATHSSGANYGGNFETDSTAGTGVYGFADAGSGTTYGVKGKVDSAGGWAGYFEGGLGVNSTGGYTGQPVGWIRLTTNGSTSSAFVRFGTGASTQGTNLGVSWDSVNKEYDITQTGYYEVTFYPSISVNVSSIVRVSILQSPGTERSYIQSYVHSSVDPVSRPINWVGQLASGQSVYAGIRNDTGTNWAGHETGSTFMVKRVY